MLKKKTDELKREVNKEKVLRIAFLVVCDLVLVNLCLLLTLLLRFEFNAGIIWEREVYLESITKIAPCYTIVAIVTFTICHLYTNLWEFASIEELMRIVIACVITDTAGYVAMRLFGLPIPRSFPIIYGLMLVAFISALRLSYRFFRRKRWCFHTKEKKRTMLIGGGRAGAIALRDFQGSDKSENNVVCIIDDDRKKSGSYMRGVRIVGGRDSIEAAVKTYNIEEIIIAIPSASVSTRKEIINLCHKTDCNVKVLPGMYQISNNEVSISQIRDVQIEDLLGRDLINIDTNGIREYVKGRVVMVTGGGGSIGSELSRQLAEYEPKTLIIFDIYENNTYDIQLELRKNYPTLDIKAVIGSVRDKERIESVFDRYRPEIVFHAAAHKHVPLMEDSPYEAIKNNVFGTLNVANAADKFHSRRMLLVSTDKAVKPTSVMGASKRICEMIVQLINNRSQTEYVAVRFGNVLGSNGSVIPLFKKQIADGGPVTVTHKDIVRYFMTIPEAVRLILQAGVYAKGGEIFVLDMGEPVRIDDLARNLIRLSGFKPDEDIEVVYTGLRPGEKLYEELLLGEEGLKKTDNDLIYIGHQIDFDDEMFMKKIEELRNLCDYDLKNIKKIIGEIIPEYKPNENTNEIGNA